MKVLAGPNGYERPTKDSLHHSTRTLSVLYNAFWLEWSSCHIMDWVLRGLDESAAAYMDDVVIFSSSWEDHCKHSLHDSGRQA